MRLTTLRKMADGFADLVQDAEDEHGTAAVVEHLEPLARRRRVLELKAAGHTTREIAEETGVSQTQIMRDLEPGSKNPNGNNGDFEPGSNRALIAQSNQNDWRTPRKFLEAAREVLGGEIDLDPASSAEANESVRAKRFFDEALDGLARPWKGRVWLNPPYRGHEPGQAGAREFVERLIKEYEVENVTTACVLLNSHPTETKWFQKLLSTSCFRRSVQS